MTGAGFVQVDRVARRWTRRGRFAGYWVARCTCGWRGPGRRARWEARNDRLEHLEDGCARR